MVAAIGVLTAGFAIQKRQIEELTSSTNPLVAETEKLIETTSRSTAQIKENIAARKSEIEDIENSTEAYSSLVDELDGLVKSERKSASEKERIQTIVDTLNNSVDGLGLAYDKENNNLSTGTGLLKERIKTMQAAEKAQKAQEQIASINKDIAKSEDALNSLYSERKRIEKEISDNRNVSAQEWDQNRIKILESEKSYQAALDITNAKIADEEQNHAGLKTQAEDTNATIIASQEEVATAIRNGVMDQAMHYALLSDSQREAVDSMNAKWQEYSDQATNMFDVLSNEQTMSVQEMIQNLQTNQQVMSEWADNITALADRGVNQGLLDKLREAGPESAGYVAALVTASDEELQQLNTAFENGGNTATESLKKAFDFEGSGIPESITGLVTQAQESLRTQMSSTDWSIMGADVGAGLSQGIENNTDAVRSSSEQLANATKEAYTTSLGIHSPSTVFEGYGKNVDEGAANGIGNNKELVLSQIRSLVEDMKSAFRNSYSDFMQIGSYLMDGLAIGIRNNADTAVSAAQSAAARVKAATEGACYTSKV